jgi:hypothetical protein
MQELINAVTQNIPEGLAKIANGRDNLPTNEAAYSISASPKTIRKHLWLYGHFHGVKPIRIGGRLFFKVTDLARLVRGEQS